MNYRHHFHAGNFADLLKHAVWLALLEGRSPSAKRRVILETHAGAGLYDLNGEMARRSSEAEAGVGRLMRAHDAPPWLARLRAHVAAVNPDGVLRVYPGSPVLATRCLGPADSMVLCELRSDDAAALRHVLAKERPDAAGRILVKTADGYQAALDGVGDGVDLLCMVDPPFETGRDPAEIFGFARRFLAGFPAAPLAIWAPLKDLESFDFILRGLEAAQDLRGDHGADLVVAEARLRPLLDPMQMNGCAMVLINSGLELEPLVDVCRWIVATCGEPGGRAVVRRLGS